MNDYIPQIASSVVGLLGALTAYIKITSDRKKTGAERDTKSNEQEHRLTKLETEVSSLQELKQTVNEMNNTLRELVGMFKARFDKCD